MKEIIADAYLQGGAILLLIALLVVSIIGIFKYIISPLWNDNKELREKIMLMNDRVAVMGEASRAANENAARALVEHSQTIRELVAYWRSRQ